MRREMESERKYQINLKEEHRRKLERTESQSS